MFDILKIELTNFRSYYGDHSIVLPTEPGLYHLTGENLDNARLGRNGTGKSTLLEAIQWCLYGRTSRGLRASDVVSWGETGARVALTIAISDQTFDIARTQHPNNLTLDGVTVEQKAIDKLLGLSQEAFSHAVIMPQFGDSFFDLAPTAKLNLLSQVIQLDFWLSKSAEAEAEAKQLKGQLEALEKAMARAEGQIESVTTDIAATKLWERSFSSDKTKVVTNLKAKLKATEAVARELLVEDRKLKKQREEYAEKIKEVTKAINTLGPSLQKATKAVAKFTAEWTDTKRDIGDLDHDLDGLTRLKAQCPTCRQTIDRSHLTGEVARTKKALKETTAKLAEIETAEAEANKEMKGLSEREQILTRKLLDLNKADLVLYKRLEAIQAQLTHLENDLVETEAKLDVESKKDNPYRSLIKSKAEQLVQLQQTQQEAKDSLDTLTEQHAATIFWVAGFKRLRLYVVEGSLRQLEIEVNSSLASLGLADWHIAFDIERENKAGGVTKGFTVAIQSPHNAGPVPFAAWSGGEGQLLRLAGALGLADLIMTNVGLASCVEFYDEPSSHLSQEGVLSLAETLHQRAVTQGKKIWLVDHQAINFGDFAGVTVVKKDEKGSRIEME